MTNQRYALRANPKGSLQVWEEPVQGEAYFIGIDTAGGGAKSDLAAAAVIRASNFALVALMRKREDAAPWAVRCAFLGTHYQNAMLTFEAYPSFHGGVAARYATDVLHYSNLYRHVRTHLVTTEASSNIGWRTDEQSKREMIERGKRALAEGHDIPSKEVIENLQNRRWVGRPDEPADKWKMGGRGHDDIFVAYSIALISCDQHRLAARGDAAHAVRDRDTAFWERREKELSRMYAHRGRRRRFANAG